ncbi:MAG: histidine kinase, partial [Saprospiraceae bacterium]|nr:histidine kinase [Saprospiraceae bacterium]
NGLYSQADSFVTNWNRRFPVLSGRIVDIVKAGKGELYIVTPENGLILAHVEAGEIKDVMVLNGQPGFTPIENIKSVFVSPGGVVWLSTNTGVYGLQKDGTRLHFDRYDGLANDDVNAVVMQKDTLWAASVSGLSRLLLVPSSPTNNFYTYITRLSYREKDQPRVFHIIDSLSHNPRILIAPDATLIKVNMAGIDYRSRGNLTYRCVTTEQLPPWYWWTSRNLIQWIGNGFADSRDTSWVQGGEINFGAYLPSGAYYLHILARSNGGNFSPSPDEVTIVVMPHWYNTIWTSLLIWLLMLLALLWFVRTRSQNRHLNARVSELQLQALQAQMNPHFIGNSINTIQQFFYSPDPVKASEYTSVFIRLLRSTMFFSEWHFIPFGEELTYLRDYLRLVKLRYGDSFHYEIWGEEELPPETPFPTMLLQPIVENAVMHGMADEDLSVLVVRFSKEDRQVVCEVEDNGIGYKNTLGKKRVGARKSKGLDLLHKKMQALNSIYKLKAQINIVDRAEIGEDAQGTRVILRFASLYEIRQSLKTMYSP